MKRLRRARPPAHTARRASMRLALADLLHDRAAFANAVFGVVALLTPLLILLAIKDGVVADQRIAVLRDPENLSVRLAAEQNVTPELLERLRADPDIRFAQPTPLALGLVHPMRRADAARGRSADPLLLPSGPGDPYLPDGAAPPAPGEVYVTAALAARIGVAPGDQAVLTLFRQTDDGGEEAALEATVLGAVDERIWGGFGALLHRDDLFDVAEWTMGGRVQREGFPDAGVVRDAAPGFPKLRVYAADVRAALRVTERLAADGIPVASLYSSALALLQLEDALAWGFALLVAVGAAGQILAFSAALAGNIARKRRDLSLLRLGGLSRGAAALFPITQALTVGLVGFGLTAAVYAALTPWIGAEAQARLALETPPFRLEPGVWLLAFAAVIGAALLASTAAAAAATRIDPAEGTSDA